MDRFEHLKSEIEKLGLVCTNKYDVYFELRTPYNRTRGPDALVFYQKLTPTEYWGRYGCFSDILEGFTFLPTSGQQPTKLVQTVEEIVEVIKSDSTFAHIIMFHQEMTGLQAMYDNLKSSSK